MRPRTGADGVDWLLQELVSAVNGCREFEVQATLQVNGLLVSGTLVSIETYCEEALVNDPHSPFHDGDKADRAGDESERAEQLAAEVGPPRYVHLRDAHICRPGSAPLPLNAGVWWRGKLSAVDAFVFGLLSARAGMEAHLPGPRWPE